MFKRMSEERGFTLIELLIVILILGALAAIAAPRFINMTSDAQQDTCFTNQAALETAVEQYNYYIARDSSVPALTDANWTTKLADTITPTINGEKQSIQILKRVPTCPTNGKYELALDTGVVTCTEHKRTADAGDKPTGGN